jgi:hypothetical protein
MAFTNLVRVMAAICQQDARLGQVIVHDKVETQTPASAETSAIARFVASARRVDLTSVRTHCISVSNPDRGRPKTFLSAEALAATVLFWR